MTTSTIPLNDVNVEAVGALVQAIQAEPTKGDTTWKASVTWDAGFRTTTTIGGFPPFATDEPETLGGTNTAPNPVEQLIGALGSCLAIGYAANASVAGIRIDDLRIDIEGELNLETFLGIREGNAGYETLRATVHIVTDADDATLAELHDKVVTTSPVGHTLSRAVPLTIELA
ncbi:MAG TPA: OsmC family peroxiredoxin [Actinobacteria bacterium]|nr:OsmC-like protein [bacterium BMS3Bbin01]HDH26995.1 OsmC family peroxiredoxin [Actinomycetota bacterium]